jgi:hypothetical protein
VRANEYTVGELDSHAQIKTELGRGESYDLYFFPNYERVVIVVQPSGKVAEVIPTELGVLKYPTQRNELDLLLALDTALTNFLEGVEQNRTGIVGDLFLKMKHKEDSAIANKLKNLIRYDDITGSHERIVEALANMSPNGSYGEHSLRTAIIDVVAQHFTEGPAPGKNRGVFSRCIEVLSEKDHPKPAMDKGSGPPRKA